MKDLIKFDENFGCRCRKCGDPLYLVDTELSIHKLVNGAPVDMLDNTFTQELYCMTCAIRYPEWIIVNGKYEVADKYSATRAAMDNAIHAKMNNPFVKESD